MKEYAKWITVGIVTWVLMSSMGLAEEKKPSVIEHKIRSAQLWAIGFGADIKQQQIRNWTETKQALKNDWSWSEGGRFTYPIKNAWEDARAQVRKDSVKVMGYWQSIANALAGLAPKSK